MPGLTKPDGQTSLSGDGRDAERPLGHGQQFAQIVAGRGCCQDLPPHRMVINKKALEGIATVVMVGQAEGLADVIFVLPVPDRESLAELAVQAIAAVEAITEDIQLPPAKECETSG